MIPSRAVASLFGASRAGSFEGNRQIQLPETPVCWVTQKGVDGFGHQLHGTITAMGLHGLDRNIGTAGGGQHFQTAHFQFAAARRQFTFQHLSKSGVAWRESERYMQSIFATFASKYCRSCSKPPKRLKRVHETWMIPTDCGQDPNVVYGLDNAFYGLSHEFCSGTFREALSDRIREISRVFVAGLPPQQLQLGTTVVHMRLGDSGARGHGATARAVPLVHAAVRRGKPVIVETDDAAAVRELLGLTNLTRPAQNLVTVHGKEESVLHALSRMVHADTFVCADSSLSISAALIRAKGNLYIPKEIMDGMHYGPDGYVAGNCSLVLPTASPLLSITKY